jgi:hypothetical protein
MISAVVATPAAALPSQPVPQSRETRWNSERDAATLVFQSLEDDPALLTIVRVGAKPELLTWDAWHRAMPGQSGLSRWAQLLPYVRRTNLRSHRAEERENRPKLHATPSSQQLPRLRSLGVWPSRQPGDTAAHIARPGSGLARPECSWAFARASAARLRASAACC